MYLSVDGPVTIYVNSSLAALNMLRGTTFDTRPDATVDGEAVEAYFSGPVTRVTRVTLSRRQGRPFVHVRIAVDDLRSLGSARPFSWSTYRLDRDGELVVYRQHVGGAAHGDPGGVAWSGNEVVGFRVHAPSRVVYHNAGPGNLKRGNILVWEQALADRARGLPLDFDLRMESQSILYHTLWLFGAAALAVAATFGAIVWWLTRARKT
jgi:hypothetical protein